MYNQKLCVSPPVKVYVIQQLCLHFPSHTSVFKKMITFHKDIYPMLPNDVILRCCPMAFVWSYLLFSSLSKCRSQVHAILFSSQLLLHRLSAIMPLLSADVSENIQGINRRHCQRVSAQPVFETDVSIESYYHRLFTISH